MKVTISYTEPEIYIAEAIDLSIRRLLPRARRKETPVQNGFYHTIFTTLYESERQKKGANRK